LFHLQWNSIDYYWVLTNAVVGSEIFFALITLFPDDLNLETIGFVFVFSYASVWIIIWYLWTMFFFQNLKLNVQWFIISYESRYNNNGWSFESVNQRSYFSWWWYFLPPCVSQLVNSRNLYCILLMGSFHESLIQHHLKENWRINMLQRIESPKFTLYCLLAIGTHFFFWISSTNK